MHVDLDPDNAHRYDDASKKSNRSVRKIINAILRTIEDIDITEIIQVKLKKDDELPLKSSKPKIIRRVSNWKITP